MADDEQLEAVAEDLDVDEEQRESVTGGKGPVLRLDDLSSP